MDRCLINAFFFILRRRKRERILSLSFFMAGLLSDVAFEPGNGPCALQQCFSADDNDLCSSDSFVVGAFKRDAHFCSEVRERPLHYPVEQRGVEPRPMRLPTLEVAQKATGYKHYPFCLFSVFLGPKMALEYHLVLFSKAICNQPHIGPDEGLNADPLESR